MRYLLPRALPIHGQHQCYAQWWRTSKAFVNRSPRGDREQYLKFLTEISGHGARWYGFPKLQIHKNPSSWSRQYGQWSAEQRSKYHDVVQQDICARDIVLPAASDVLAMIEETRRPDANRDRSSSNEQS